MLKIKFLILTLIILTHCSIDSKSGIWKNKNFLEKETKISKINFDKDLTFEKFKENIVLYGKKSKYPDLMNK